MGKDINIDEEEVLVAQIFVANKNIGFQGEVPHTDAMNEKMKVSGLLKVDISIRLKQAVADGMAVVENIDPDVLCSITGKIFALIVHWDLLTPDWDELIYDELRDIDVYNFYAPIAS